MAKRAKKDSVNENESFTAAPDEKETAEEKEEEVRSEKEGKKEKKERRHLSENSILHQVMPIVMLALCAFFGICIYTDLPVGIVGEWVHVVFFGALGLASYFVPFFVLALAFFWQRDVREHILGRKIVFGLVSLILIAILFYTFGVDDTEKEAFASFWQMGTDGIGGGALGGFIGFGLYFCVAKPGTVIVTLLLLTVFAVLFFNFRPKRVFDAAMKALHRAAEARAEARRRAAEARTRAEERKREQRERAEEDFYTKKAVSAPADTVKSGTAPKRADTDFFMMGHTAEKKPVSRTFFDAAAEDESLSKKQEAKPPKAVVPFDDDLFNDSPIAPEFLLGEEMTAPIIKKPESELKPDRTGNDLFISDTGEDKSRITVVSDKPIPERPAERPTLAVPTMTEVTEEKRIIEKADGDSVNEVTEQEEAVKEEKLIINKAHTIEHLGADTFIDEADEYYKAQNADTFFYSFPPLSLLREDDSVNQEDSDQEISEKAARLKKTLESYGVQAEIKCISRGPRLTRYELVPREGVRIRAVESLVDEIAMNLEAVSVRIEAPIPGKAAIGVEVPNVKYSTVRLRGLLDTDTFRDAPGKTTVCLGVDVVGVPVFADLDKMPHLLVAGATGMGKSVCINSILISLLYKARPDEVKLILIDPKKVEFKSYYNIPHLLVPVVTEPQKAAGALSWAVNEMERRYDIIERTGVRNIKAYNSTLADHPEREKIPQIVIVIDELHDLMLQARDAVEDSIARIAAKARAAGILLIIGTQRPSVNVITGVIKANIPSRIAFHVASQVDSRTILDAVGAEKLLNDGDMLFLSPGMKMMTPKRVQGAFLDDDEVTRVADYLRKNSSTVRYDESIMADMDRESEKYNKEKKPVDSDMVASDGEGSEDDLLYRAIEVALENGKVSTSLLQRKLSLGFGKAARMIDRMEEMGIVSAPNGQKPRDILITMDEYRAMRLKNDE